MKRLVLLALFSGFLVAADSPTKDAAKAELDKIQGTWVATAGEENGEKFPEEVVKKMKMTLKGDEWTFQRGDETLNGTMKLDPSKKIKTFDAKVEGQGDAVLGIYELEGDNWKICWSAPGGDRPTEFTAKADSGRTWISLKKEKK
jgi:uncharacterized protein (TIGR03067 family)